ncbi:DUF6671 family protein [Polaribacter tangerinus]|uniref:DUF6671 family protein n=1 Tax=Polaribacter tangerinus TaxID=1920034 RepID=UPI000B4B84EB|nr:DUF6671 family protein [Polaribacter tangerinus]
MFAGRKIVIATKHQKEKVIAPLLTNSLEVLCFVPASFDSDVLGTFSGEVDRKKDALATAKEKCLLAMEQTNTTLGIASEGSFGAHPTLFFAAADEETLVFIDQKNNLEISVKELSTNTNFNAAEVTSEKELREFATLAKFPSHGLILRKSKDHFSNIYKGITSKEKLLEVFYKLLHKFGKVYVETDMRAMYNPSRMKVIESATKKLINKIKTCCPACNTPGFEIVGSKKGLPCSCCNAPTQSTLSYLYSCKKCNFTKEEMYPRQKTTEDPTYCEYCNP